PGAAAGASVARTPRAERPRRRLARPVASSARDLSQGSPSPLPSPAKREREKERALTPTLSRQAGEGERSDLVPSPREAGRGAGGGAGGSGVWCKNPRQIPPKPIATGLLFLLAAAPATAAPGSEIPRLVSDAAGARLVVDGRPFIVLGGELGNSNASN